MLIGAHLSIAGGMGKALEAAQAFGFETLGLFVRNQRQWRCRPLDEEQVESFRKLRRRTRIGPVVAHGSYLVNLAGSRDVRRKSIVAMREDLDRCGRLGIEYLVIHPGSHQTARAGIRLIAKALNALIAGCSHRRQKVLLETTAGGGRRIGSSFEQLAEILALLDRPRRFGVCLDTCHVFAAGYDIRTARAYERTMAAFDRTIGLGRLLAVHVNDSLRGLGSGIDRHSHIGHGCIGLRGFANLVNDARLADVPLILETHKGKDESGRDWDLVNAETLRALAS